MIDPLFSASTGSPQSEMNELIAQNQSWLSALEQASDRMQDTDSNAIGRFGAKSGFLVLQDKAGNVYAKDAQFHIASDGRLLDEHNRAVLGFSTRDGPRAGPAPLKVSESEIAAHHFARYDMDERGILFGILPQTDQLTQAERVELGRLCIAIFPAPQELVRRGWSDFVPTIPAGPPKLFPADAGHLSLQRQPASPEFERLRDNARKVWSSSTRAELDVALADSEDALVRIALNVVK
jgi:hypothetical protein